MGDVEDFHEWLKKRTPQDNQSEKERKEQQSRVFHLHLSQAMARLDGPIAQLILLGVSRKLVMEMAEACYSYWVDKTTLEEPDGGNKPGDGPDRAS